MPPAWLLNQINKICETERPIYPFSFVYKHITSPKSHLSLVQGENLAYWFRANLCGLVCFDLLIERISFVCSR